MKRITCALLSFLVYCHPAHAQELPIHSMNQSFDAFQKSIQQNYAGFVERQERSYEAFRDAIEKKWSTFKDSTPKEWVNYTDDFSTRSAVNFEDGFAVVEVLIDSNSAEDKKAAQQSLYAQLQAIDKSCQEKAGFSLKKGGSYDMSIEVLPNGGTTSKATSHPTTSKPPVSKSTGAKRPVSSVPVATALSTPKTPVQPAKPVQEAKKPAQIVTAKVALPSDYLQKAAEKYRDLVYSNAARFDVETKIIYAVIHTESCFNPFARSHVPAFGLMQLVSASGGKDAYHYVYKKNIKPSEDYLYVPENNILLGTAYLSKLKKVYFKGVRNEESLYILSIAAYNTGMGNVARALTGTNSLSKVPSIVNAMSPKQLRETLLRQLPYDETKKYLTNVLSRSAMYSGI